MAESAEKLNKNFILNRVNPILEKMLVDILIHKPEKMVPFMTKWLDENGEKYSNDQHVPKKKSVHTNAYGESSEEEDDEEAIEELPSKGDVQVNKLFKKLINFDFPERREVRKNLREC
jgi:hypothetical protein